MPSITFDSIEFGGHRRYFACLPSDPRKLRSAQTWTGAGKPLLPKSEWKSRSSRGNGVPLLDQGQRNSCTGWSSTRLLMNAMRRAGHPVINLAPGYLYAWINGGRDQGANISDALDAMVNRGICPADKAPANAMYRNQFNASHDTAAKLFRADKDSYLITTWEEAMSAGTLGYDFEWSICAGNATPNIDKYGVAGFVRGPANHAVCGDGIQYIAALGDYFIDWPNTWGPSFGNNGRAYAGERHFECDYREMYAVKSTLVDSSYDETLPPAVAA